MEFYALNAEQHALLKELMQRIRRLQSGGTLDSVAAMGINTDNQIGASFLSLRTLARSYKKDDKIATILWNSEQREEQIVACFLFTTQLNREKIIQLLSKAKNQEIIEYFGSLYLFDHPLFPQLLKDWSNSKELAWRLVILSGGAKHIQRYKSESKIDITTFEKIVMQHYDDHYIELVANRYRLNC